MENLNLSRYQFTILKYTYANNLPLAKTIRLNQVSFLSCLDRGLLQFKVTGEYYMVTEEGKLMLLRYTQMHLTDLAVRHHDARREKRVVERWGSTVQKAVRKKKAA